MTRSAIDILKEIEPTFQETGPWRGYWQMNGRPAYLRCEDGWLEGRVPLCGDAAALLDRQHSLPGLGKLAAGDFLCCEVPAAHPGRAEAFRTVRGELFRGLGYFEGAPVAPPGPDLARDAVAEAIEASGTEWTAQGVGYSTPLEDGPAPAAFAVASAVGDALAIRSTMTRLRQPPNQTLAALAHFLLAFNQRVRLARGSLCPARVVLEVVLPAGCVNAELVRQAVRSLRAGAAAARRECAALSNPRIAEAYLQFHVKGANK